MEDVGGYSFPFYFKMEKRNLLLCQTVDIYSSNGRYSRDSGAAVCCALSLIVCGDNNPMDTTDKIRGRKDRNILGFEKLR